MFLHVRIPLQQYWGNLLASKKPPDFEIPGKVLEFYS